MYDLVLSGGLVVDGTRAKPYPASVCIQGGKISKITSEPVSGAEVLDVGRDALWLTIQLCLPALIVALVVGVAIGLFQALTQIQEQTLVYAPKIIAIFVSLLLFLPLMGALLGGFMREIAARIAGM